MERAKAAASQKPNREVVLLQQILDVGALSSDPEVEPLADEKEEPHLANADGPDGKGRAPMTENTKVGDAMDLVEVVEVASGQLEEETVLLAV